MPVLLDPGNEWLRKGLLLQDEQVLDAMDDDGWARLCASKKRDGTIGGDVADREQLALLKSYVFRLLAGMVDDIASGNVEPNPYTRGTSHDACSFCPYSAVCRADTVCGRRNYKAMTDEDFWERIGKEESHG